MDLFCGTGSIGLTLAKHCQHVYGFEVAVSSIADAKRNAVLNHITNATFVGWDLTKVSASLGKQYPRPDVIVTGKNYMMMQSCIRAVCCSRAASCVCCQACMPGAVQQALIDSLTSERHAAWSCFATMLLCAASCVCC